MKRAFALAVTALAIGPSSALAFEPSGEVIFHARGVGSAGASFDGDHVVGPVVNMTRRDDGSWAGDISGHSMDLLVSGDGVKGANVQLALDQDRGRGKTSVRGLFFGTSVNVTVADKEVHGRFGQCSIDLARRAPGLYEGNVGCMRPGHTFPAVTKATLKLWGDAASKGPPAVQLALALVTVLPN